MQDAPFSGISRVDHIGAVVKDVEKAVEYYESLGIGPFETIGASIEKRVRGKVVDPSSIKLKVRTARMGPVNLELLQPVEGESVWKEFLETRGEGIQHIAYKVDSIDSEMEMLLNKGFMVLYSSRFKGGGGDAYFDTGEIGGVLFTPVQWSIAPSDLVQKGRVIVTSVLSKVDQLGVIVRNVDKAVEYYQSLGIGPFETMTNIASRKRELRGKAIDPDSLKVKIKYASMGPLQFELIEPVKGESHWKEFLETRGEGIQHLGFFVDDIDKSTAQIQEKGVKVLYRTWYTTNGGATYFDTGDTGGILMELIQRPR